MTSSVIDIIDFFVCVIIESGFRKTKKKSFFLKERRDRRVYLREREYLPSMHKVLGSNLSNTHGHTYSEVNELFQFSPHDLCGPMES